MQPKGIDLEKLAMIDPVAAYGLLMGQAVVPISMNILAQFSTLAVPNGQPISAALDTTIGSRFWIDNMEYSLQCPNVFPNQVFKTQFDAYLKESPGVSVQLEVQGGPKYLVSEAFTPLENLVPTFNKNWTCGWLLRKNQTIQGLFQLTQAPGGAPSGSGPYSVTLTFNGFQFEDYTTDKIDMEFAKAQLRAACILHTKDVACPS